LWQAHAWLRVERRSQTLGLVHTPIKIIVDGGQSEQPDRLPN
jgi:hypothetical protein